MPSDRIRVSSGEPSSRARREHESAFLDAEMEVVGAGITVGIVAQRAEGIVLEQVEDRDAAFLFDIGAAPHDRAFVERDVLDAMIRHGPRLSPSNAIIHSAAGFEQLGE